MGGPLRSLHAAGPPWNALSPGLAERRSLAAFGRPGCSSPKTPQGEGQVLPACCAGTPTFSLLLPHPLEPQGAGASGHADVSELSVLRGCEARTFVPRSWPWPVPRVRGAGETGPPCLKLCPRLSRAGLWPGLSP